MRGGLLVMLAVAFAVLEITAPLIQHSGEGLGMIATACLLYAGVAAMDMLSRLGVEREACLLHCNLPLNLEPKT